MEKNLIKLFKEPKIIGVVGNTNEAKSNLLYFLVGELYEEHKFKLVTYGLKVKLKDSLTIYSVEELEQIKDSIIVLDEVMSLWDLDDRKIKKQIETTLRLINHNNNILILCFLPENVKKFIASKLTAIFFKKSTISDFINGSKVKRIMLNYKGNELGSSVLELPKDETILFDGNHYTKYRVPYIKECDTKLKNVQIIVPKKVEKEKKNETTSQEYIG
jgi:hypothetical protein